MVREVLSPCFYLTNTTSNSLVALATTVFSTACNKKKLCVVQAMNCRQRQLEMLHAMLLKHHEQTQDVEYRHLDSVQKLRDDHMSKQHRTELDNQLAYTSRALRELKSKHATAVKQLPKNLKVRNVSKLYVLSTFGFILDSDFVASTVSCINRLLFRRQQLGLLLITLICVACAVCLNKIGLIFWLKLTFSPLAFIFKLTRSFTVDIVTLYS